MTEREKLRTRETEAQPRNDYEAMYALYTEHRNRAGSGRVVVRGSEQPWQQARQGLIKYFLSYVTHDAAVRHWALFLHDIRTHSGKHRHQGGIAIYVVEGRGWTVVDGVRYDWEEGDLILLPTKPEGVEHQHFNAEQGKPCKWLAMIHTYFGEAMGSLMEQKEVSPDWPRA
ncbi:MAG: cupin domain-containing protein [Dehalococcoidia bacterium]|nr:cupin domain-containing protein [Dehalococcoidia bacterium]